jgi:16S rRNA processing protein RimM
MITKPHGVRGEIRLLPDVYDQAVFLKLKELYVDNKTYALEYAKIANDYIIVKIKGVDDRDAADAFRNKTAEIDEKDQAKLPEGVHYIRDLIGCGVYAGEERIGTVKDVLQNGAADVYVVIGDDGREIMFPALKDLIKKTDTENKIIVLDKKRLDETAVYSE